MGDAPHAPAASRPMHSLGWFGRGLLRCAFAVIIAILAVATVDVLTGVAGHDVSEFIRLWAASLVYVLAAAVVILRAVCVPSRRAAWIVLAVGLSLYAAGNVVWTAVYDGQAEPPIPSISDALWLLLYPTSYAALVMLGRDHGRRLAAPVWLDGMVAGLGFAALGAALVFEPVLHSATGSTAAVATNLAYPFADLVLAVLVIGLLALRGWRLDRMWALLGAGFLLLYVADSMYLLRVADGSAEASLVPNLFYLSGVMVIAFAAWQPERDTSPASSDRWSVLIVPGVAITVAIGILLYDHFGSLDLLSLVLATLTLVAGMVRTAVTFREVRALAVTRQEALTDELTALPNRRLFFRTVTETLEAARTRGESVSLLIADLDGFKKLNDTLGHGAGDVLLRQIGPRLGPLLREGDMLARLGGDEFGILVRSASGAAAAQSIADRIIEATRRPFEVEGLHLRVTVSIGIALSGEESDVQQLMRHADVALYQAKLGRTGRELYVRSRDTNSRDSLALASRLPVAIAAGELAVHYQPQVDATTRRVLGMEALVRWRHPERGLLAPGQFVDLAEQAGLMRELTAAVLGSALATCRRWHALGHTLHVAVNVSFSDLLDSEFPLDVAAALAMHDVPPVSLVLEVTESSILSDATRTGDVLARLSELGVRLALDDFGTGFSSLAHLRALPVTEVKIDRSFISRMRTDATDRAIVRSTVQLAHNLGLTTVAEGVEDEATWDDLRPLGCDVIQGYIVSRPLALEAADAFLAEYPAGVAEASKGSSATGRRTGSRAPG